MPGRYVRKTLENPDKRLSQSSPPPRRRCPHLLERTHSFSHGPTFLAPRSSPPPPFVCRPPSAAVAAFRCQLTDKKLHGAHTLRETKMRLPRMRLSSDCARLLPEASTASLLTRWDDFDFWTEASIISWLARYDHRHCQRHWLKPLLPPDALAARQMVWLSQKRERIGSCREKRRSVRCWT